MQKIFLDLTGVTRTNLVEVLSDQLKRQNFRDERLSDACKFLVEKVIIVQKISPRARYNELVAREFDSEFCITFR